MSQWMPDINANNEMSDINLMILMQSSKQTDSHITLNSCVAVEHFTYLASELFYEMLLALGMIDVALVFSKDGFSLFLYMWCYKNWCFNLYEQN